LQAHFDHYDALILLFFLNPVLRSIRALQQAGLLKQVDRNVGCSWTSLESLSDAVAILEPARLEAIVTEPWAEAPSSRRRGGVCPPSADRRRRQRGQDAGRRG
jgi:hypothetical protein